MLDVRLDGFTPATHDFLTAVVNHRLGHPELSQARPAVIPFEVAAALFFVLRATDDREFPGPGRKWSTLLHLGRLLVDAAVEVDDNPDGR